MLVLDRDLDLLDLSELNFDWFQEKPEKLTFFTHVQTFGMLSTQILFFKPSPLFLNPLVSDVVHVPPSSFRLVNPRTTCRRSAR